MAATCFEAVWWRCHWRIVAGWPIARGESVFDLMGADRIEPATLSAAAEGDGRGGAAYAAG